MARQPSMMMRSLLRCCKDSGSSDMLGTTSVGVADRVSASLSLSAMPILGTGPGLARAGLPFDLNVKLVSSGLSNLRCSRDMDICRAMEICTGSRPKSILSGSSRSDEGGWVMCVCADEAEDGDVFLALVAADEGPLERAYVDGSSICQSGSWILCLTVLVRMISGMIVGESMSMGDSRTSPDSFWPK